MGQYSRQGRKTGENHHSEMAYLYPEGCEAWAEQRRTGYPRLIKVAVNNSGNTISTDDMIRRVFFNQDYKTDNKALYDALVSKLGGADNGGTRLWWDTGRNNF